MHNLIVKRQNGDISENRALLMYIHNSQYGNINREPNQPHICKPI